MSSADRSPKQPKTLGPVRSLDEHLSEDWWQSLFGPLYLETDADVLAPENTCAEVDRVLELLNLEEGHRVLDLCCGHGRHALELARRGFRRVEGLDQSKFLIEKAREAATENNLDVVFRQGDSRRLPYDDRTFDVILVMGNSFGYFDDEGDNRKMLEEVRRVLKGGGQLLLDLTSGSYMQRRFEPRSWEWIDDRRFACRERELTDDGKRLVARELVADAEEGVLADQFYAERLYTRPELEGLLLEAGFGSLGFADGCPTRSSRDQDLGMMARRVMVTAIPRPGRTAEAPASHVAVVLGDPRLPDAMKLGGEFGEADFEVIRRLKEALGRLDGFHFTYLDDHRQIMDDLQLLSGDIDLVFNLCDEGFENAPRQELHVPALLEMLDMPYTGGSPQCLSSCYDKSLVRGVAREMDIPVAAGFVLAPGETLPAELSFGYPAIVKPNAADSSIGITKDSVVHDHAALKEAVASVCKVAGAEGAVLVEAFLTGKDLTVSLIGNGDEQRVLPITEDDYTHLPEDLPPICGYEAKWLHDSPYYMNEDHTVEAELTTEQREVIVESSRRLFERLGCRDYARFDWRLDESGSPHLLEANPNPGWCWDGHMVLQAAKAGLSYAHLLQHILEAAARRYQRSETEVARRQQEASPY